ncbi:hypothetical protein ACFWAY_44260 [Rhodococcus sp. NPDC059968]|uniref:hypothetical protein n=1 Tax=Rhodococcus sp. NPDC059968 TaxID=3347017 RepID=UPI00366D6E90
MGFWWASQGKNYPIAIRQGSLWTCRRIDGTLPTDRALLKQIRRGDIVFHHYDRYMRAVSVVTAPWRDANRPTGYPTVYEDLNDGWLVTVDPIVTGLAIHFELVAELLPHGSPGPLDKNGRPLQKYLSRLAPDCGLRLLAEVGLIDNPREDTVQPPPAWTIRGATDMQGSVARRLEQTALRAYLLEGNPDGSCGLCGRTLPATLLVAGHIKPRAQCTDTERWDFPSAAMLVCTLGCDTLFEQGYLTVDRTGTIIGGRTPSHPALVDVVHTLVGRPCAAYTDARADAFRAHHDTALTILNGRASSGRVE